MKAAVIVFPGTNCDRDTYEACSFFGWNPEYIWHNETELSGFDAVFLPGGFSYGDYIHSGRLAKFSPVIKGIKNFISKKQGIVIGICNGFQILCESGLLPGILTDNINCRFICDETNLDFYGTQINLPIAHREGRYVITENISIKNKICLKYINNPNGSTSDIAGLYDRENKILAMMPHPERRIFKETGNIDGRIIFEFIQKELNQ